MRGEKGVGITARPQGTKPFVLNELSTDHGPRMTDLGPEEVVRCR
ncbi:MAG: hypothetical protein BIP78_0142 [Candidatus Bipolaricaulis sibiricus]|uniref:Uncharacterized protein n=1 Tax=Bipolaricaulis sibiricus TaxID=2501609 RepID=A0A410FSK3_BIPS1|nr:MAG: hypothetical protein BIP78_0142 [Candidatus Bipolaricaulis sibiricus]